MSTRTLKTGLTLIALSLAGFAHTAAHGQSLAGIAAANASFDQRMAAINNYYIQQNQNAQMQLWQRHLQVNGPRLQAQYRQYLASGQRAMTFEQFAYWDLMTAAGTNVQGALNAQRAQFEGNQRANATIQSGHASYNAGWADNSARTSAAMGRYSEQAIRGNSPQIDPGTGRTIQLPYYLPQGQTVTYNGYTYAQDAQGTYWRHEGNNNWTRVQAGR
jgi:hypothetical protein